MDNERKRRLRLLWQGIFLALLIIGTIFIARQRQQQKEAQVFQKEQGFVFGTVYNITYQGKESQKKDIEAVLKKVDNEFSIFNERSTVSAINRGEHPARSAMFCEVYNLAQKVNRDTDGAFDISVAPLVNAWGFGFKTALMPTPEQVDSLLKIRNQMDFAAIAKGYGCDMVARMLKQKGINNFMVEIGGEVVVAGKSPSNEDWRIGVTKPTDDSLRVDGDWQTVLQLTNTAMATSGNYRNYYYNGGRKYAHTIDPRTGYPVQHSLLSATVMAPTCAIADAYATAFMVMGVEKAKDLLAHHSELKAYLIYSDKNGKLAVWTNFER